MAAITWGATTAARARQTATQATAAWVIAVVDARWSPSCSSAITQAAAPYLAWLDATAARARQTATQATAAASAKP
ncbi:hypothetical protein MAHJHV59_50380 [Mycobacterium avium subsp. hominissuis]